MATNHRTSLDPIAAALIHFIDEHAAGGVFITDTDLAIRSWNRWLAVASNIAAAQVVGRPLFEVLPSLEQRGLDSYYREALAGEIKILSHTLHRHIVPCRRQNGARA